MKINNNNWIIVTIAGLLVLMVGSCTDPIELGNDALSKAPGGTVTKDTVFSSAKYTREFLTSLYSYQYYGLPYYNGSSTGGFPENSNPYVGKSEVLSD